MEQKSKVFNLNNFIQSETGRLTSLSIKRDLSLGGNKPKKIYKPNLNVIRNKNKAKISISNKFQNQQQNKSNVRPLNFKGNHNQRYIQSSSVFSEGAGELRKPKIYSDRYLSNGDRDQSMVAMPKIIKTKWEVDTKEEKCVINELLADEEDASSSENEGEYSPVVLPLKNNKVGFMKTFQVKKEDLDDVSIKEEIPTSTTSNHYSCNSAIYHNMPLSFRDNKFYNEDHPCVSLLRMPDSLPGKGFVEDSDKVVDFNLNQMIEGKIGKISIRKSGIIEVQIGKMKYVLDSVESNPFKEDLMSVPHETKLSGEAAMVNLGNIDEKYILSPNWKNLFNSRDIKKK
ncbi:RNA polymerase III RPC4 [Popillia japonica]|uniref:RNA polymerase III RPC4 n=1 Tax=Popillia japonica TaxID=7064 RepID=A0AAW1KJM6_POPJA